MATPYVYERQTEYWISRQIEEFFLDAGFEVLVFPLSQYTEHLIPSDFIFFDRRRSKLFGFQYKALYHNSEDFWLIDEEQHQKLARFPWVYYCLSELKTTWDHRAALHLARIVEAKFEFPRKLYPKDLSGNKRFVYSRWGAFYQGLERCTNGVQVSNSEELQNLLKPKNVPELPWELSKLLVDIFIVDFESRHSIHLSPQLCGDQDYNGKY
jgi:hypothetical protein